MRFALGLLACVASAALAEEPSVRFDLLDLDGDGYLSISEAAGIPDVVTRFERADRDHDGRLSQAEFSRLDRIRVRTGKARPDLMRATVSRYAREAAREADAETAQVAGSPGGSAAAGASR